MDSAASDGKTSQDGSNAPVDVADEIIDPQIGISEYSRWPKFVQRSEQKDLDEQISRITSTPWPPFEGANEEQFEAWLDQLAAFLKRKIRDIDPTLLKESIFEALPAVQQAIVRDVEGHQDPEDYINAIALELYPASRLLNKTMRQLLWFTQEELSDIVYVVTERVQRFGRLVKRHNMDNKYKMGTITAYQIGDAIKPLLPPWAAAKLDLSAKAPQKLLQQLKKIQVDLKAKRIETNQVWDCEEESEVEVDQVQCHGCLGDHLRKECPHKDAHCLHCGKKGHLALACRNYVHHDGFRQIHILEPKRGGGMHHNIPGQTSHKKKLGTLGEAAQEEARVYERKNQAQRRRVAVKQEERNQELLQEAGDLLEGLHAAAEMDEKARKTLLRALRSAKKFLIPIPTETVQDDPQGSGLVEIDECDASHERFEVIAYFNGRPIRSFLDSGADLTVLNRIDGKFLLTQQPDKLLQVATVVGEGLLPVYENVEIIIDGKRFREDVAVSVRDKGRNLISRKIAVRSQPDAFQEILAAGNIQLDVLQQQKAKYSVTPSPPKEEDNYAKQKRIFEERTSEMDPNLRKRVWDILERYKDVWVEPKPAQVEYKARFTVNGKPFRAKLRHYEPKALEVLKEHVEDQLRRGVIRPSNSEWAAAPHFVKKKTGELRLVIDYRRLNQAMTADAYPLPRLWSHIRRCAGRRWYVTLDMASGFWNVPLSEDSKHLTAFVTPFGLFESNVIPFGIKNSMAEFQRAMDSAFASITGEHCALYIDDVMLSGETESEVMQLLERFMQLCREKGFFLRLDKCDFMKPEVDYLGFRVGRDGIKAALKRTNQLRDAEAPTSKKSLRSFLGVAGHIRSFVPNFSEISAPLSDLLRGKESKWEWGPQHQAAFERLKEALTADTVLQPPQPGEKYIIYTDASDRGIGAVLKQQQGDKEVIIEYASKKLSEAEQRWDVRERELFAIKWAIDHWRDYVALAKFVVRTDHNNLRYLISVDKGKVFRWCIYLAQFDFDIEFVDGSQNNIADFLSRHGLTDPEDDELIDVITRRVDSVQSRLTLPPVPTWEEIKETAEKEMGEEGEAQVVRIEDMLVHQNTLMPWIAPSLRNRLISNLHYGRQAHSSVNATYKKLKDIGYWKGMKEDVQKFVKSCLICAMTKRSPQHTRNEQRGTLGAPTALHTVACDHIGPIQWRGQQFYILAIIDHATRFMKTGVLTELTAEATWACFEALWIDNFGNPNAVLTDGGTAFKGAFHEGVTEKIQARHLISAPYRPQGNGICERSHATLQAMVTILRLELKVELPRAIYLATQAYNSNPHTVLGISPYEALFGRPPIYPGFQSITTLPTEEGRKRFQAALIQDKLITSAMNNARLTHNAELKVGDLVVAWDGDAVGATTAMALNASVDCKWTRPNWTLPMRIVALTPTQVTMQRYGMATGTVTRHRNQVKQYVLPDDDYFVRLTRRYLEMSIRDEMEAGLESNSRKRRRVSVSAPPREDVKVLPDFIDLCNSDSDKS